ncbi:MAG: ArsR/SmtB family transcription factor [Thermoplasmatota archaeon]
MFDTNHNDDIISILYSFKDIIRVTILDLLYTNIREGASFKDIVREVGIGPTTAAYHLNILKRNGLVEKEFHNEEGRRDYSFYHITPRGERAYVIAKSIHKDIWEAALVNRTTELPDIQITHLRYGPRCISIEKPQG